MMGLPALNLFTPEEYLAFENPSPEKHEFFDGHIIAMPGASPARGSSAAMEKAIAAGADVFAPYYNYRDQALPEHSTFSKAAEKGNLKGILILLKQVQKPGKEQKLRLSFALCEIRPRRQKWLSDYKADEEAKQAEMLAIAEALVGAGADVNFRNGAPLVWHVANGEVMELLIRAGGNVNAIDANGSSAVFNAVQYKTDALKVLIKHKADVNRPHKNGLTV